ncbi:MAG: putative quinol monooxygenase [Pseudomonadota bacterium]
MYVVTVRFTIEDSVLADFMPLMQEIARRSLAVEPGCHRFDVCQDPDGPQDIFLYEIYTDEAAFAVHKTMPHYAAFTERTAAMITEKSVQTYTLLRDDEG